MTMGGMRCDLSAEATPSRRWMRWLHLLAAACMTGCTAPPAPPSIDEVAEGYVRVALQLAQHDPELVEDWRGPALWRPGPRVPVAVLKAAVDTLQQDIARTVGAPAPRHRYLSAQLRALDFTARRLLGDGAGIDQQAKDEFGVEFSQAQPHEMDQVRETIDRVLPGAGPLAERFMALTRRTTATRAYEPALIDAAMAACRDATTSQLELGPGERTQVRFRSGLPWDGYARYAGQQRTDILINADAPLDVARALRLACHEAYPGHHVQHLLIEQLLAAHDWPELRLSPGFGPHLLFLEGAAEVAAGLAFSPAERTRVYRDLLLPAAALPTADAETLARMDELLPALQPLVTEVARRYLGGTLSRNAAAERLRNDALILNAEGTLSMFERRRARALVYGEGRRAVASRLATHSLHGLRALFAGAVALQ